MSRDRYYGSRTGETPRIRDERSPLKTTVNDDTCTKARLAVATLNALFVEAEQELVAFLAHGRFFVVVHGECMR